MEEKWVGAIVMLALVSGWYCPCCYGCLEEERIALVNLKHSIPPPNGNVIASWGGHDDCCKWVGVECKTTTRRVIQLSLNYARAWYAKGWYLNSSLFLPFEELKSLSLSENSIFGFMENEGLERLSSLSNLEVLDLSDNQLNNSILPSLASLSALKVLNLASNQMEGSLHIPGVKRSLKLINLEALYLWDNSFSNTILSSLKGLPSLTILDLSGNKLKGILNIEELVALKKLKELDLSRNEVESFVTPKGVKRPLGLNNLEVLYLGGNSFNNRTLSSLKGLPALKILYLNSNKLKGMINIEGLVALNKLKELDLNYNEVESFVASKGIKRTLGLNNLEVLYLWHNSFSNRSLSSLRRLPSLRILDLSSNKLKGILNIEELVALNKLKELDLSDNEVESFVTPKGVERSQGLSNLEVLHLSSNSLSNKTLSSLKGFSSLRSLDLSWNKLKGILNIEELATLNNLKELDLRYNEVESFVAPEDFHTFKELEVLLLDGSTLHNNFLQGFRTLNSLKVLSATNCQLNGTLPSQDFHTFKELEVLLLDGSTLHNNFLQGFGTLNSLKVLSATNCQLNGTLPSRGWCELQNLKELDLSENNLQEMLPSCLRNLSHLQVLDISSNHFTGNIASGPLANLKSLEYLSFSRNNFQVPVSFMMFANHSKLKALLGDDNIIIPEPLLQTPTPKFKLIFLNLSYLALKEPPYFLYHQNDLRFVDLSHNNLTGGFLSWLLKNNTGLKVLNLGYNSISGPLQLPSQPHFNITILDVTMNGLLGKIPTNMSLVFPHLRDLTMSKNSFEGQILASFSDMKSLQSLRLSNNHLSGSIPDSLGRLSSLGYLDLSNNQLSGGIPELLVWGCPLEALILSSNNLQGQVFPLLFNLTGLIVLQLHGNNFSGEIPDLSSINSFSPWVIDISNNHFSGKLPRWMGNNISIFNGLSLSKNHFEGPIPVEFCGLRNIDFLDLSDNNLSGHIPKCLNPIRVRFVHLSNNRLTGPLIEGFFNNSLLEILDLSRNNLTGIIPGWIGGLSSLSILLLKGNHFEGKIPVQLCQLNRLRMVDLSQNNLSGSIPFCLSNLKFEASASHEFGFQLFSTPAIFSLSDIGKKKLTKNSQFQEVFSEVEFWVEFTTKSISYVYNGSILNYMAGIDLSCNHLTGRIPLEVGYLNEIRALNVSHNKLKGPIPSTFSNLKQIESLDLSYNNLNGRIPPQLTELNTLAVFSVAYNNLSGPTPDQKAQFGTFDESSYEGNPFLCGAPLQISCTKIESPSVSTNVSNGGKENNSSIDISAFYGSFVATYVAMLMAIATVLYINPYWRRAWFYFIEVCIISCYYFVLDNFCWLSQRII